MSTTTRSLTTRAISGFIFVPPFLTATFLFLLNQAFTGAHHQFTHGGEVLLAAAFMFPYLRLGRVAMWVHFVTLQLAMWTNGAAYVVAALSGDGAAIADPQN